MKKGQQSICLFSVRPCCPSKKYLKLSIQVSMALRATQREEKGPTILSHNWIFSKKKLLIHFSNVLTASNWIVKTKENSETVESIESDLPFSLIRLNWGQGDSKTNQAFLTSFRLQIYFKGYSFLSFI